MIGTIRKLAGAGFVLPFIIFWSTLDRSLILPLVTGIAEEYEVTVALAATAITTHAFAYAGMQIVWGPLSARWGRVRILALTTALAAVANIASALAPDITTFLVARTASGGAVAATFAAVLTYFGDSLPLAKRSSAMSNLATATALGLAAGPVLSGAAATWLSWHWVFAIYGVGTALLVPVLARLPEPSSGRNDPVRAQFLRLVRNAWALGLCAITALEGFLLIGIYNLLPVALQQAGGEVWVSGLVTAAFGVSVVIVSQSMKLFMHILPPWGFLLSGGVFAVAGMGVLVITVTPLSVLIGAILMGIAWALAHTTLQIWMTDAASDSRALGMTLFSISLMMGGAIGAAVGAVAVDRSAFPALFLIGVLGAVLFTVSSTWVRLRYRVREF